MCGGEREVLVVLLELEVERGCNFSQQSSSADTLYLTCGERELILLMRGLKIGCC